MSDLIENYLACWNETDPSTRRDLIAEHFAPEPSYVDPMAEVQGRDALDALIAGAQAQFPGFVFSALGPLDQHHDVARFSWGLGPADEQPPVVGFDVVALDADGRIAHVLGFLDRVPG
jgi:hypothetical protein